MSDPQLLHKAFVAVILAVLMQAAGAAENAHPPYRFGVFPYLSPLKMDAIFAPVSHRLADMLDRRVRFRTASTMSTFVERLKTRYYDFAILQPVLYPLVTDRFDYVPIATFEERLSAQILVLSSSRLKSVDDLKGKVIATPPLFGPIVHLTEHELEKAGIVLGRDVILRKKKSIDACVQQMAIGRADACLAPSFSVPNVQKSLGLELRVLFQSGSVPNRLLVVRKQLPPQDQAKILKAFVDLRHVAGGHRLLDAMDTKGFVAFDREDYEEVRTTLRHMELDHYY
jgi:phosphonate transport system substrate-binding protein